MNASRRARLSSSWCRLREAAVSPVLGRATFFSLALQYTIIKIQSPAEIRAATKATT